MPTKKKKKVINTLQQKIPKNHENEAQIQVHKKKKKLANAHSFKFLVKSKFQKKDNRKKKLKKKTHQYIIRIVKIFTIEEKFGPSSKKMSNPC